MSILPKRFKQLCTPALVYFILSMISTILIIIQNLGNSNTFCMGSFSCDVPNTSVIIILKILYILFWTWILNIICKNGYSEISWFIVLFPFIFAFILLGLLMVF
jgi:hypothetical protein